MTAAFDPALVTITRKRFSTTQGEVLVEYAGQRIEQYGDKIEIRDGEYQGYDDALWIAVAKREALARGLAVEPTPPAPAIPAAWDKAIAKLQAAGVDRMRSTAADLRTSAIEDDAKAAHNAELFEEHGHFLFGDSVKFYADHAIELRAVADHLDALAVTQAALTQVEVGVS